MSKPSDRRLEFRSPLTLLVDYPGTDDLVSDFTENLSMGGTFVQTARELEIGSDVHLLLSCPGLIEPIGLRGIVRWTRAGQGQIEPGAGIQFTEYGEDIRRQLRQVIDAIASNDPDYVGNVIKLLIVEDNQHIINFIRDGLMLGKQSLGANVVFQFTVASDGRTAIDHLQNKDFDAAIVDMYLPIIDGVGVIKAARTSNKTHYLPIIAISAGGREAADDALEAGADRFLSKPIRLQEVLDALGGAVPDAR